MTDNRWDHVVRHLEDAVVEFELVDGEPIVRRVNRAFEEDFGLEAATVEGTSLNDAIVPDWLLAEARDLDARTSTGKVNYERVRRQTATGLREFLYRGIPYDGTDDAIDGFAIYTDLSGINRRERQLQVLNRILRHNLRNRATVISGQTTRLLDAIEDPDDEIAGIAATIEAAAHDLELLAGEAGQIKRVLESQPDPDATVDCPTIVRDLLEEYRVRYPDAGIEADLPRACAVAAGPRLSVAVDNLLENAIEHNPAPEPRVRARLDPGENGGWVDLYVEDDGPRIPATERAVVSGERPISETEHGQGLGLWLVRWTVEQFGGEVAFDASEFGGNSVRLRLPRPEGPDH